MSYSFTFRLFQKKLAKILHDVTCGWIFFKFLKRRCTAAGRLRCCQNGRHRGSGFFRSDEGDYGRTGGGRRAGRLEGQYFQKHPLTVCTVAQPGGGWLKGVKFHPLSDPGRLFSIQTIKCCSISLPTFHENKEFTWFWRFMPGLQGPILSLSGLIPGSGGPIKRPKGTLLK